MSPAKFRNMAYVLKLGSEENVGGKRRELLDAVTPNTISRLNLCDSQPVFVERWRLLGSHKFFERLEQDRELVDQLRFLCRFLVCHFESREDPAAQKAAIA